MRLLIVTTLLVALVMLLAWRFPGAMQAPDSKFHVLYYLIFLIPMLGGALAVRGRPLSQTVSQALLWVGIILLLMLAYGFRDEVMGSRLVAELLPSRVRVAADGSLSVRAGEDGHFHLEGEVNGARMRFMLDTGASDIVLSPADAGRAGFDTQALDYRRAYGTANGVVRGAPVRLARLTVGPLVLEDIEASVNGARMEHSLLGMSFLRQLRGYRVEGNTLTLVP